MLTVMLWL